MDIDAGYIKNKDIDEQSQMSIDESGRYHLRKQWMPDEDRKLLSLVNDSQGRNWKKIANLLGEKTSSQCSYRYQKLITEGSKAKWNRTEDIQLLELTEKFGNNWVIIASKLSGKTPEEAKQRFTLKLDPKLKRSRFDKEEDELILRLQEKYGNNWNEISRYFPNRNSAMIKNRYYSYLKNKNKDSTTLNVTGSETLSNYSLTPSMANNTYIKNSYSNFNGRNTVSYNDNNLNNFKEKMLIDSNILDYENFEYNNNDIDMFIDIHPSLSSNYLNNDYGNNKISSLNDDIYTDIWNTLPEELVKVDGSSPKTKVLEPEDKFNEEYNNVFNFRIKKNSFDDNASNGSNGSEKDTKTDNESLMKQYQLLESVFNKIYEVSTCTNISGKIYLNFQAMKSCYFWIKSLRRRESFYRINYSCLRMII
jgi:hypothetical protein